MAFPAVALMLAGAATWASNNWLTRTALDSPDYVPRFTDKGMDARGWLIGIGLGGLILGPMWPMLGSLAVGGGVGALTNYSSMGHVEQALARFTARQPAGQLEDQDLVSQITSLLQTANIPLPG